LLSTTLVADIHIITSKETQLDTVQQEELRNLYLGRTKFVQNKIVFLIDHQPDHPHFLKKVIRKSEYSYRSLWKMKIFTGKGKAPIKIKSIEELLITVARKPNVIAYTSSVIPPDHPTIKVLTFIQAP
jgi:hypothetical protein